MILPVKSAITVTELSLPTGLVSQKTE